MRIGKAYTFEAAHMLEDHPTCGSFHGHSYIVNVEICSDCLQSTLDKPTETATKNMVLDFKVLNKMVNALINQLDHKNLNAVLNTTHPTAEAIALWIHNQLEDEMSKLNKKRTWPLHSLRVRVQEGVNGGWAEV